MKKHFFIITLLYYILSYGAIAQSVSYKYWIGFKDKACTQYSLSHPEAYLSQRAIDRRQHYNIPIDSLDLPVCKAYLDSIAHHFNIAIRNKSKWLNGCIVDVTDTSVIDSIQNISFVSEIKRIYYHLDTNSIGASIYKTSVKTDYGYAYSQEAMLKVDFLHEQGYKGEGKIIAILDAGFKKVNEFSFFDSLRADNRIIATHDFVEGDTFVYERSSHGTGVLSVMGAIKYGEVVGTAPHASYILLISEDANAENIVEEYNWVCAAEFADSAGADLINSSLGYTTFDDSTQNHNYNDLTGNKTPAAKGANIAFDKGMIVVVSAGNSGNKPWHYISTPGDATKALTVGAVDNYGEYAPFSSTGPTPDGRIKPDVVAQGYPAAACYDGDSVSFVSGTSFSSPIMCGAVACLWQAFPDMDNATIVEAVKKSASQYFSPDSLLGYGIPDFEQAYNYLLELQELSGVQTKEKGVFIYPNPIKDKMNISFFVPHSKTYLLFYGLTGNLVFALDLSSASHSKTVIINDLHLLPKGIYTVKIIADNKVFYDKVIKL